VKRTDRGREEEKMVHQYTVMAGVFAGAVLTLGTVVFALLRST
jgi:hypothetical protein